MADEDDKSMYGTRVTPATGTIAMDPEIRTIQDGDATEELQRGKVEDKIRGIQASAQSEEARKIAGELSPTVGAAPGDPDRANAEAERVKRDVVDADGKELQQNLGQLLLGIAGVMGIGRAIEGMGDIGATLRSAGMANPEAVDPAGYAVPLATEQGDKAKSGPDLLDR